MSAPQHQHDCDECRFLGINGDDDLYAHDSQCVGEVTLILRHSSWGSDYAAFSFRPETWRGFLSDPNNHVGQEYRPAIEAAIAAGVI